MSSRHSFCKFLIFSTALHIAPVSAEKQDVLRFSNSDQLHGVFNGIDDQGRIIWQRKDSPDQIPFAPKDVMSVILSDQQSYKNAEHSFVRLTNGDVIPCQILQMNDKSIKLQSSVIGSVDLNRDYVTEICPQPFGKTIRYLGPYSSNDWMILSLTQKDDAPENKTDKDSLEAEKEKSENAEPEKKQATWHHHGITWYRKDGSDLLTRKDCLGDSTMMRFRAKWLGRLNLNIALHADFSKEPEKKETNKEEDGKKNGIEVRKAIVMGGMFMTQDSQNVCQLLGNSLLVSIQQNYITISQCGYDKDGKRQIKRISQASTAMQIEDSGDAVFEIRSDRKAGLLLLYMNGQYIAQWEYPSDADKNQDDFFPLGNGIAFQASIASSPISISDIVIADWSGVRDPANSFHHETQDIALLHNGIDRYSGTLESINDGMVHFKSSIGHLQIPVSDLAEIHLAHKSDNASASASAGSVTVAISPLGKIAGKPLRATQDKLTLKHSLLGETNVKLERALILEYSDENSFLYDFQMKMNDNEKELLKK